jgi:cystathionine beta-lyase
MEKIMSDLFNTPERRGSDSVKWGIYGGDVLPMWVADMDFTSPKAVIEALRKRVEHGVFGYPLDSVELAEQMVERMKKLYDWEITTHDLLFIPGVVPGFNLVCQTVTRPGESILIQTPVYAPILHAPQNAQARGIHNPLEHQRDGSYGVDFESFEAAIAEDTRCFLLCNPHNPIGKVFSRSELERMAEICLRHDVIVCSDEIHSDLVYPGNVHLPIATLSPQTAENTITLIAPSKTYNIAGLECSILICTNPILMEKVKAERRGLMGGVNLMGMAAGTAAYRDGEEWLKEVLKTLKDNRDFLNEFVRDRLPEIKMHLPEATYLAWLDCRELALEEGPYKFFLKRASVALNKGEEFGEEGGGFVRLNFGCTHATLEEALLRMERAVKGS